MKAAESDPGRSKELSPASKSVLEDASSTGKTTAAQPTAVTTAAQLKDTNQNDRSIHSSSRLPQPRDRIPLQRRRTSQDLRDLRVYRQQPQQQQGGWPADQKAISAPVTTSKFSQARDKKATGIVAPNELTRSQSFPHTATATGSNGAADLSEQSHALDNTGSKGVLSPPKLSSKASRITDIHCNALKGVEDDTSSIDEQRSKEQDGSPITDNTLDACSASHDRSAGSMPLTPSRTPQTATRRISMPRSASHSLAPSPMVRKSAETPSPQHYSILSDDQPSDCESDDELSNLGVDRDDKQLKTALSIARAKEKLEQMSLSAERPRKHSSLFSAQRNREALMKVKDTIRQASEDDAAGHAALDARAKEQEALLLSKDTELQETQSRLTTLQGQMTKVMADLESNEEHRARTESQSEAVTKERDQLLRELSRSNDELMAREKVIEEHAQNLDNKGSMHQSIEEKLSKEIAQLQEQKQVAETTAQQISLSVAELKRRNLALGQEMQQVQKDLQTANEDRKRLMSDNAQALDYATEREQFLAEIDALREQLEKQDQALEEMSEKDEATESRGATLFDELGDLNKEYVDDDELDSDDQSDVQASHLQSDAHIDHEELSPTSEDGSQHSFTHEVTKVGTRSYTSRALLSVDQSMASIVSDLLEPSSKSASQRMPNRSQPRSHASGTAASSSTSLEEEQTDDATQINSTIAQARPIGWGTQHLRHESQHSKSDNIVETLNDEHSGIPEVHSSISSTSKQTLSKSQEATQQAGAHPIQNSSSQNTLPVHLDQALSPVGDVTRESTTRQRRQERSYSDLTTASTLQATVDGSDSTRNQVNVYNFGNGPLHAVFGNRDYHHSIGTSQPEISRFVQDIPAYELDRSKLLRNFQSVRSKHATLLNAMPWIMLCLLVLWTLNCPGEGAFGASGYEDDNWVTRSAQSGRDRLREWLDVRPDIVT